MHLNLTLSCNDHIGLIHKITTEFYKANVNIVKLEEHVEDGHFFIRIRWNNNDGPSISTWNNLINALAKPLNASFFIQDESIKKNLILMCSKESHCILDIVNHIECGHLNVNLIAIISNHHTVAPIADRFNIPFHYCPTTESQRENQEKNIITHLNTYSFDCIGLARYMRILSPQFLSEIKQPIINVHHAFLPSFVGANPYKQAFDRGVKMIGATAHYVNEHLDDGPIISQKTTTVSHLQSVESLKEVGRLSEQQVFFNGLKAHCENKVICFNNRTIVFN